MSTLRTQRSNVRFWHKAAAPAGDCRVRFRGYSCRDAGRVAWQLMTHQRPWLCTAATVLNIRLSRYNAFSRAFFCMPWQPGDRAALKEHLEIYGPNAKAARGR